MGTARRGFLRTLSYLLLPLRGGVRRLWGLGAPVFGARFVEDLRREVQHGVVAQRGTEKHCAVGSSVGGRTQRYGDAEQVEQIPEVRVVAEHRVAVDWFREHL